MYGLFLEDINFAVDGGMYAEMVKNGSFEFGALAKNSNMHGYSVSNKETLTSEMEDGSSDGTYLNENNTHYAVLANSSDMPEGIGNKGYLKGMAAEAGANYVFSVYLKGLEGYTGTVTVCMDDLDGNILAESTRGTGSEIPPLSGRLCHRRLFQK